MYRLHRNTYSRESIAGEAYIPIPREYAREFEIYNSNYTDGEDVLGKNVFYYTTIDGEFRGVLKAQGSSTAGDIYAKQFSVKDNLKEIGEWFEFIGAQVGTEIRVEWLSAWKIQLSEY